MTPNTPKATAFILSIVILASFTLTTDLAAQAPLRVMADEVECIPIEENSVAHARVENNVPDTTVRLYFRRMHDVVEDLYWVQMNPEGQGRYWGLFPKAEDRELDRHELIETREESQEAYSWAAWWRQKDASTDRDPNDPHDEMELDDDMIRERASVGKQVPRTWLATMDDETFEAWLEQLENEPTEYYVSVHDAEGRELARSPTMITEVRKNCRVDLTPRELGESENLTVGETAHWQRGEQVFHWLCAGIVLRVDPANVLRRDNVCSICPAIITWKKNLIIPAIGTAVAGCLALCDDEASRSAP